MRRPKSPFCVLTFLILQPAVARGEPPVNSGATVTPAVIAVEIDVQRFRDSATLKATDLDLNKIAPYASTATITIEDVDKVSIVASVPEGADALNAMNGNLEGKQSPFGFQFKVQLNDSEKAAKTFKKLTEKLEEAIVDGRVYYRNPSGGDGAANFTMHRPSANTILAGTDDFVESGNANLMSTDLRQAWQKLPNQTARLAVDLQAMRALLKEFKEKNAADPNQVLLISFIENLDAMRLAIDLDASSLITLVLTGKDDQSTTMMQAQLDSIVLLAQSQGAEKLSQLPPKSQPVVSDLLKTLKTQRDENDISLVLTRPDGFEDALAELTKLFAPERLLIQP